MSAKLFHPEGFIFAGTHFRLVRSFCRCWIESTANPVGGVLLRKILEVF